MKEVKTMLDIAHIVGVSESTVSRALKDSPLISQKTKEKIKKIALDHQFSVNRNAQNLSNQKPNAIVVIVNLDFETESLSAHQFTLQMLGLLADELAKNEMEMILSPDRNIIGCWHNHFIRSKRADGIIVLGPGSQASLFDDLAEHDVPFVVWGGREPYQSHCVIAGNNREGGLLVVGHLSHDAGRKRIVLLGPRNNIEGRLRYEGYREGLEKHGCVQREDLLVDCDWSTESGFEAIEKLLHRKEVEFDAIFALNDTIAFGAIQALQAHGLNVPDDISVVGYDNISTSQLITPRLTSVRQDTRNGVKILVQKVLALTNGEKAESVILNPELIVRQSSVSR